MVSTRFNIFGYAIVFLSLHFVAYSLQDIEKTMISRNKIEERVMLSQPEKVNLAIKDIILNTRKNVFFHIETLNVVPVGAEVAVKGRIISGRKMARMVNEERLSSEEATSNKASSSSENPSNDDHKPRMRSNKIYHDHHQVEGNMSSTFMVINADYYVPRSHPPKHN